MQNKVGHFDPPCFVYVLYYQIVVFPRFTDGRGVRETSMRIGVRVRRWI